jgi:hypothetical protein
LQLFIIQKIKNMHFFTTMTSAWIFFYSLATNY